MLIMKKFDTTTPASVALADGNAVADGRAGVRWRGAAPNFATGATGNPAAATGGTYITTIPTAIGNANVIAQFHSIQCAGLLTAGNVVNYVSEPLVNLGFTDEKSVRGLTIVGVFNPAPTVGANPTPTLISAHTLTWHITEGKFTFIVPGNSQPLVQGFYVNCVIYYQNLQSI